MRRGFAASTSSSAQRHCYVRSTAIEQLLETPGAIELLAAELGVESRLSGLTAADQLDALRRRAIHLAVTTSPFQNLSLEEIVVVTAYAAASFDGTAWKRELRRQPSQYDLERITLAWLRERAVCVGSGSQLGRARWPLVGSSSAQLEREQQFVVAGAPLSNHQALEAQLEHLGREANFANEHYIACSPATALAFLEARAGETLPPRWDPLALDRELRTLGLGLLLIEAAGAVLYLPAHYHPPTQRSAAASSTSVSSFSRS
ncbi:MAG TPA: hypothetical protein VEQ58_05120 [Polyangiaceae bacterium]|nr:hypothetical protein [Polyangiaceae bacterium]